MRLCVSAGPWGTRTMSTFPNVFAEVLSNTGADLILCPHLDAADRAVEQLLPVNEAGGVSEAITVD